MLGRVHWTFAYMGLGYAVAGGTKAAAGVLSNLKGLPLSFSALIGLGLLMWMGRMAGK